MFTDVRSIVAQELERDERLIWYGQPASGIRLRSSDVFLIPFSILWGGFAFFWEYSVATMQHAPGFFVLWGIPFVAMGIYLIFGRFLYDARRRAKTFYGVTEHRIIIVSGTYERKVTTVNLANLPEMTLAERSGGLGTITFGSIPFPYSVLRSGSWPSSGREAVPQFELIEDTRKVYQIVRDTQRRGSEGNGMENREVVRTRG